MKHKNLRDDIIASDTKAEFISTGVVSLNLMFSGMIDGGIQVGAMNMMSAPSQLGKSFVGLNILKNAQKRGMDCIVLHTEKNFPWDWARKIGVETEEMKDGRKLIVYESSNLTKLKQFIAETMDGMTREQRKNVFILVDSWGSIITTVQNNKAKDGSETRDMSEAYWKNGFANIMNDTDATYFVLNHVYDNTGGFGDPLNIPGGRRLYFNCHSVVLGSSVAKFKDGSGSITGDIVTARTHKGRGVKRYTTLKYRIKQSGGLDLFYGLLPDAIEHGSVIQAIAKSTGKLKAAHYVNEFMERDCGVHERDLFTKEFWVPIFKNTDFADYLEQKYTSKENDIDVADDDIADLIDAGEVIEKTSHVNVE